MRKNLQQDSEQNAAGNLSKLLEVLVVVLREVHIPVLVRKTFVSIEISQLRAMLGLEQHELSGQIEMAEYLRKRGMQVSGGYAYPSTHGISSEVVIESSKSKFELTEERVESLTNVVQFLET